MSKGMIIKTMGALDTLMTELSDSDLEGEKLAAQISRTRAITECANQMIRAGTLVLQAQNMRLEYREDEDVIPPVLRDE